MDALVRTRDGTRIDLTGQFLTTSMLPKLAALHDQGSLVFLFATNYQEGFDPAIKRPGRFDVLLCVGPPPLREKLRGVARFLPEDTPSPKILEARRKLRAVCQKLSKADRAILDLLTFKEMETFLASLSPFDTPVLKSILHVTPAIFGKRLTQFSQYITLRTMVSDADSSDKSKESTYERYKKDQKESRLQ
jgi:SpoVK/Ycf46/Vps4 family AAA+-type ATPase